MSVEQVVDKVEYVKVVIFGYLCAVFFLLSPILSNLSVFYKFSLGDISILASLVICIFSTRKFYSRCFLGVFSFAFVCLIVVAQYLNYYPEGVMVVARMSFYIFSFFIILSSFRNQKYASCVRNIYIYISVVSSLLLVCQVLLYHVFDVVIVYIDTPIDIQPNSVLGLDIESQGFRSGGLFKEPSYFAVFVAPAMIYTASLRRWFLWSILSCAVTLSTSALGFVFILLSLVRFFNFKYLMFFSPFILIFLGLVFTDIIPILPARVVQTMNGEGSFSIRVIEPFLRVFVDGDVFLPSYSVLKDLADPDIAAGIWFNSISYAVAVLGLLAFIPIGFMFAACGRNQFVFMGIMLVSVNGLTTPFFLVSVITLKLLDDITKCSPRRRQCQASDPSG